MIVRPARADDRAAIWSIVGPTIRAGETYALPRDMSEEDALAYWLGADRETFVAEIDGKSSGPTPFAPTRRAAARMSAIAAT